MIKEKDSFCLFVIGLNISTGLDFDDFMGETITDSRGYFEISGYNAEMTPIDPKVNIYHDCNDGWWVGLLIRKSFLKKLWQSKSGVCLRIYHALFAKKRVIRGLFLPV